MIQRQCPPRDTWWHYTKRFGTLAWYCVSRILILVGAMILTATILTYFFPDLINTTHEFWEVREQSLKTQVEPLQMAPLLLNFCAQVIALYGTGYVLLVALIATLNEATTPDTE